MDAAETSANAAKARLERMASVAATATRVVSIEPMLAQVVASAWVAETCTDPAAVVAVTSLLRDTQEVAFAAGEQRPFAMPVVVGRGDASS